MDSHKDEAMRRLLVFLALAARCAGAWVDKQAVERTLADGIFAVPYCQLIHVTDERGVQIAGKVTVQGVSGEGCGQDLLRRSDLSPGLFSETLRLSDAYVSALTGRICLTAICAIRGSDCLLGFLAAHFDLRSLPGLAPVPRGRAGGPGSRDGNLASPSFPERI